MGVANQRGERHAKNKCKARVRMEQRKSSAETVADVFGVVGDNPEQSLAKIALHPSVQAASIAISYGAGAGIDGLDIGAVALEIERQADAVRRGDLGRAEAMLIAQAHVLDVLFATLARQAAKVSGESNLKLALKAQSQCRATLETLALMKNPAPVAFVRQANIGQAVQVNNGVAPRAREEIRRTTNELLGEASGERLDQKASTAPGAVDSALETLGPVHGTEKRAR